MPREKTSTPVSVSKQPAVQDPADSDPSGSVSKGTGTVHSALLSLSSVYGEQVEESVQMTLAWTANEEGPDICPDPAMLDEEDFPSSPGDVLGELFIDCPDEVVPDEEVAAPGEKTEKKTEEKMEEETTDDNATTEEMASDESPSTSLPH